MNILVTGGCGFVGRHLVKRLLSLNHEVTIVDNIYKGSGGKTLPQWPRHLQPTEIEEKRLTLFYGDCRQYFQLYPDPSFDQIFHLAAVVGGREVIENDPLAVALDLSIDAEFFHWCSRLSTKPKIHYFSSSAAYGTADQEVYYDEQPLPLPERYIDLNGVEVIIPDMTYGWAKLTGEFLAKHLHEKYGHDIICFRPFSGYGEDQDLSYPFPALLRRVLENETPITIWGSGDQQRDFIYIEDCIDGILQLSPKISDGSAVNLSTGEGTSFKELVRIMDSWFNRVPEIITLKDKPEGVFKRVGDTTLQKSLGFIAKTPIEIGIERCINYLNESKSTISDPAL